MAEECHLVTICGPMGDQDVTCPMSHDLKEASDWLILEVKFLLRFKLRGLNINIGDLNLP